ncbi:hypothetical protein Tco_1267084 [Tanacetum coccineum]
MMDADYQMDQQLQAEEQEQLSIEEKLKLFVQLLKARKKHFAEIRAREKRNKPPTQAQQRKLYCNYLKNMEGYTPKQLKGLKFEVIKDMFDKAFKRGNTFVDYKTELVEGSEKRADDSTKRVGTELEQEPTKKQKFDREDLENLWKLVKAKHRNTRPEEGYERVLWGDLKTMLYDSCEVHFVRFEDKHVYILVEKRYPLTPAIITDMLNKKLKSDYWNEMCYQLLKLMTKQLKNPGSLMLLVYKLLLLVFRVNAAGTKLQLLTELQLLMDKD